MLGPARCPACGQWFVSVKRQDLAVYCSDRCLSRDAKRKQRAVRLVPLMLGRGAHRG